MENGLALIPANKIPPSPSQLSKQNPNDLYETVIESSLSAYISRVWERNRNAKRESIEQEMLEDLRAKKGEYSPKDLAEIKEQGGSEIYMMLTNAKIRGLKAWLKDVIMNPADRPWEIEPTPIPDLPPFVEKSIALRIRETMFQNESQSDLMDRVGKLRDMVLIGMRERGKKSAERMSDKIADQLEEGCWDEAFDQFLDDFATFPAAILKGPIKHKRTTLAWSHDENQNVVPIGRPEIKPEFKRISPFDCYPSPDAETPNDGEFIEHVRFQRRELRSFLDVEGYSNKAISDVLEDYGAGGLREWLWMDHERKHLEGKDHWWMRSEEGTMDGIHFWGSVQGKLLIEWGIKNVDIDPLCEYEIDAIKIGRHVIRSVINKDPLARRPYHKSCFDPVPGSFWGNSLRFLMRDIQRMCNATARAISNNVGMASGPMMEVHEDKLHPDEDAVEIRPWKIIQTMRGESTGSAPNVHFYQPNLNAHELLRVYEEFERRADDATGVPRYATGNERVGGAGRTSSGLAMLMSAASRGIKAAIYQIDLYTIRTCIEQLFFINMVESTDPTIKGDAKIVARGATALLVKEQAHAQRMEFMQMTNNEFDMSIIGQDGRAQMLREHSKELNMPNLIPSDDELKTRLREQQEQAAQQEQPQDPRLVTAKVNQERYANEAQHKAKTLDLETRKAASEARYKRLELKDKNDQRAHELRMKEKELAAAKNFERQLNLDNKRKAEAEVQKAYDNRNADIANIMKEIRSMRKEFESQKQLPPGKPSSDKPSELHVHIDNKSGAVTKRISVDKRDAGGKIESLTSTEES